MSGEKTEQPSHKKLEDSRKKGDVPKSKDFTQTLLTVSLFGYLIFRGRAIFDTFVSLVLVGPTLLNIPFRTALAIFGNRAVSVAVEVVTPVLLIVVMVSIFAETIQVGVVLAFEKLKPSAKKMNPIDNLKHVFSAKNGVEFLKSALKIAFLSILVWKVILHVMPQLMALPRAGVNGVFAAMGAFMQTLLINVSLAYATVGVADLAWQRYQYRKGLMMSKDEIKQEYKEMEGDPHVKSMRKHLQKELVMQGAVKSVKRATVLVTNPTHFAVALYYEKGETPLPVVLAKGEGALAEEMIREARREGVPILQNISLARALTSDAEVGQYIPDAFIQPVAEVLRLVRDLGLGNERS